MENFFLTPSIPLAVYIAIAKKEKEESGFDSVLCIYDLRTSIRTTRTNNTHKKWVQHTVHVCGYGREGAGRIQ